MSFRDFAAAVVADESVKWLNLVLLEGVDSTNRYARDLLRQLAEEEGPTQLEAAIVGYEQSAGRGRQGRSWVSKAGLGLYLSLVRPIPRDADLERATGLLHTLPLLVGVALCRALQPFTGAATPRLKWPNDVLVEGGKVGGVLIEVVGEADGPRHAVIGIGLNRSHDRSQLPTSEATSLRVVSGDREPELAALLTAVLTALGAELEHAGDRDYAIAEYRRHTQHREGETMRCRMAGRTIEGTFLGFDNVGHLRLESGGREVLISAGEVVEGEEQRSSDPAS